ncbi:MAG: hypothetical protein KF822_09420 [Steroidobacteraceae bacterium]|nr:hypothetical protein [Steroidobacteraceae bacterium]
MTAKVIEWNGITRHDVPAERILQGALDHGMEGVVLMGYDNDGELYLASSYADGGTVLWLMEQLRHRLMGFDKG